MHKLLIWVIELPAPSKIAIPISLLASNDEDKVIQTQPHKEIKEPAQ